MKPAENIEKLIKNINIETNVRTDDAVLNEVVKAFEKSKKKESAITQPNIWRILLWSKAGYLAAAFLIVSSWVACWVLSRKVTDLRSELEQARRDIAIALTEDSATINFYLREHQDVVARNASLNLATPQPVQMRVSQHDIMYYEIFDDQPEFIRREGFGQVIIGAELHGLHRRPDGRVAGYDYNYYLRVALLYPL